MIGIELVGFLQFTPLAAIACAVAMVVLRAGASRVFFDIVGTFQASKMIKDADSASTVLQAIWLDSITSIQESGGELLEIFTNLADEVVPIARNIEEARIQFDKFLSEGERTGEIFDDIASVGEAFGFAADDAYNAASRMAQLSGVLGGGTTAVGTEIGMVFGLISGMDTQAGMQRLINLQQQTKFMTEGIRENATAEERRQAVYKNSMVVLDQLNTVENRSAATMSQITYVMNQFASQAHLTGESIAAMAAMSATLIEAGEEQGKGGRALRMIYARLGANTNGAADAIKALGIEVIDTETGAMRPFSDILEDLSVKYQAMNGVQQQNLAQGIAGNRHYTRLIKLLENVDRVRELEAEAIEGLFPAMEEAERRRETELFQLEQMEVKLENYQAALGDQLLPTLTAVTETQVIFTDSLVQLYEGPLGPIAKMITGVGYGFKQFIGPLVNTIILLYNAKIAFGTYIAIQKSLNEVVLSGEHAYKNQIGQLIENTMKVRIYNTELRELRMTLDLYQKQQIKGIPLSQEEYDRQAQFLLQNQESIRGLKNKIAKRQEEIDLAERQRIGLKQNIDYIKNVSLPARKEANIEIIAGMRKQGASFDELQERQKKNIELTDRLTAAMRRMANTMKEIPIDFPDFEEEIEGYKASIEEIEAIAERRVQRQAAFKAKQKIDNAKKESEKLKVLQAEAEAYNTLTLQLGIAGSALMLFGRSEKAQRAGMLLNAAAIGVQIWAMYQKQKGMIANIMAKTVETYAELASTAATTTNTGAIVVNSTAKRAGTVAAIQLAIANAALAAGFAASTAAALAIIAPLLLVVGVAYLIAGAFKSSTDAVDDFRISMADLETAKGLSDDLDITGIESIITEQEAILEDLKFGDDKDDPEGGKLADMQREQAQQRLDDALMARDIEIAAQEDIFDVFNERKRLNDEILEQRKKFGTGGGAASHGGGQMTEETARILFLQDELAKLEVGHKGYFDFFERNSLDHVDKLGQFVGRTTGIISDGTDEAVQNIGTTFDEAADKMYEFSNAREEMFYGFSADRLTGDLIRQVHQQGVETLITTTEVIMTNTFNGMTVPEVALQILEEIESQGNLRGYNFANPQ